mgnify:FL=1
MTNNNTKYNVTIVNPNRGTNETHVGISAKRINFDANTFNYNFSHPACEILKITEIPQSTIDAESDYFKRYGTECE